MRRKNGRSGKKQSPERPELDSSKKLDNKQSSGRHKRSSSRSSADSHDEQINTKEAANDGTKIDRPSDAEKSEGGSKNNEGSALSPTRGNKLKSSGDSQSPDRKFSKHGSSLVKDDKEDSQEQEEGKEETEEKKNKGKSKGKNKSNIEQSSNIIEPEIENENVQGTPQSPSIDNADNENVQNVNDPSNINVEHQEGGMIEEKINVVVTNEQENAEPTVHFESEYAQEYTNQNAGNLDQQTDSIRDNQNNVIKELEKKETKQKEHKSSSSEKSHDSSRRKSSSEKERSGSKRCSSKKSSKEERSTTPELKDNKEASSNRPRNSEDDKSRRQSTTHESSKGKTDHGESSSSKKKITLRRSPPESKENEKSEKSEGKSLRKERRSNSEDHGKETDAKDNKPSKKITLKRPTVEDKTSNEGRADAKSEGTSSRRSSTNEELGEKKRRLSSLCEDKGQDAEEKPRKPLKKVKLVRILSRAGDDADEERTKSLSIQRRQKWATSDWLNKLTSSLYKVDVESIKIVCPSMEFLGENEVSLETTPRRRSEGDFRRKISVDKSDDSDRPDYEKQISEDSSGEQKIELNPNIIAMNRKISIVDDTASKLKPPPSPAKHPTSDVLFITNLVRPFTVKQLKELLERTGKIREDGFWTDRIKSKCYVRYETVEEAEATRNALHGVHWPIGNGKKLVIDYATVEDLEKANNPAPPPAPAPLPVVEKVPEKENRVPERSEEKYKDRDRDREERKRRDGPIREWDLGKENSRRGRTRSRSRSRERGRKHSRRSYTPDDYIHRKHRKMEESVPQKLMDDLFLKTKATPSIYWQPLSPEEIITKQKQRLVRMEEHKRRIEETRERLRERRGSFRRR